MEPSRTGPFPYVPVTERPRLTWPDGARVALWVIPNVEVFPLNEPIGGGTGKAPDVRNWAMREYGARVGFFRLAEMLAARGIRGSATTNSEVCDAYPQIVEHMLKLGWEILGHNQSNARRLIDMDAEAERAAVFGALERLEAFTGRRPRGWLSSGLQMTWQTLDLLVEAGCDYVADWVVDDQPYTMTLAGGQLTSVPYSLEINDLPQFERMHRTPDEFAAMIRRTFDVLYREGAGSGRVMAVALHPFVSGVPHRIDALAGALDYILAHERVWVTTGAEIADAYRAAEGG